MKRSKLVCIILCVLLSLTLLTLPFVPIASALAPSRVAKIGDTEYASLSEAVTAAKSGDTITILKGITQINAAVFQGDKDLTVDFNGNTVDVGGPFVGSTGTETNRFQLLKGSNTTFKNGVIKALPSNSVGLLFQNYCNLTLDNITIDARPAAGIAYALSNNCGNITIKGNTNIYASSGKQAFDLWYGMDGYPEGISITFDDSFTGTVEGRIEYGAVSNKGTTWNTKTKLIIKGDGTFNTTFNDGNSNDGIALADSNIKIYGGTFTNNAMLDKFVDSSCNVVKVGNLYKVAPKATAVAVIPTETIVKAGGTTNLTAKLTPATSLDAITFTSSNNNIATVDETGKVTGVSAGNATITATVGAFKATCAIRVYKAEKAIAPTINPEKLGPVNNILIGLKSDATDKIDKHIETVVGKIAKSGSVATDVVPANVQKAIKQAVDAGKSIKTKVGIEIVDHNTISQDVKEDIMDLIKDNTSKNGKAVIAHYLDLNVKVLADNKELGTINKLSEPVKFTVAVPNDLLKDGRKYYVVRVHNGVSEKLAAVRNADGTFSFETDRFSTFALVYEDETPTADASKIANTGDSETALAYVILVTMATAEIIYFSISERHNRRNNDDI